MNEPDSLSTSSVAAFIDDEGSEGTVWIEAANGIEAVISRGMPMVLTTCDIEYGCCNLSQWIDPLCAVAGGTKGADAAVASGR